VDEKVNPLDLLAWQLLHPREKEEKVKDEGKNGKGRRRSSDGDFLLKEVMGKN